MSGYVAIFDSIFTGTLHGRWPDLGLWPLLLAMADRHGVLDVTPQYIATMTGLPVADVVACIERSMAPDPHSRSSDHDGRRLVPLDPARPWGWRIVNYAKYRERQRKKSWDAARTASGDDRRRKSRRRAGSRTVPEVPGKSRRVPTRPDDSRLSPLSSASASASALREGPSDPVEHERSTDDRQQAIERVFAHWQQVHGHVRATLDAKRRKLIGNALNAYSEADLCQSISGYRSSPHHMGQNDRATVYDDIGLLLRDAAHIDAGLRFHADPPRTDLSLESRRIVDQTRDWTPPEARHAAD